jgi:hypothetical protein
VSKGALHLVIDVPDNCGSPDRHVIVRQSLDLNAQTRLTGHLDRLIFSIVDSMQIYLHLAYGWLTGEYKQAAEAVDGQGHLGGRGPAS